MTITAVVMSFAKIGLTVSVLLRTDMGQLIQN